MMAASVDPSNGNVGKACAAFPKNAARPARSGRTYTYDVSPDPGPLFSRLAELSRRRSTGSCRHQLVRGAQGKIATHKMKVASVPFSCAQPVSSAFPAPAGSSANNRYR